MLLGFITSYPLVLEYNCKVFLYIVTLDTQSMSKLYLFQNKSHI